MTTIEMTAALGTAVRIERTSSAPSPRTRSYTYRLHTPVTEELIAAGLTGIYEAADGTKLIYSQNRLGQLNQPFNVPFRLVAERKNNVATGRIFLNLVDAGQEKAAEEMAAKADKVAMASRFFGAGFEANVDLGNGVIIKIGAKQPTVEPVVAEPAPAKEPKAEIPQ